jgi:hypothetical protein
MSVTIKHITLISFSPSVVIAIVVELTTYFLNFKKFALNAFNHLRFFSVKNDKKNF